MEHAEDAGISGRCMWCGQVRDDLRAMPHLRQYEGLVVPTHAPIRTCADHAEPMHAYLVKTARNSRWTLLGSVLAGLLVVGGGMARADGVIVLGLLVLGAGLLLFPYCTPETVRRLGVLQSVWLARFIGVVVTVVGVAGLVYLGLAAR